jgi:hypothetical protein
MMSKAGIRAESKSETLNQLWRTIGGLHNSIPIVKDDLVTCRKLNKFVGFKLL